MMVGDSAFRVKAHVESRIRELHNELKVSLTQLSDIYASAGRKRAAASQSQLAKYYRVEYPDLGFLSGPRVLCDYKADEGGGVSLWRDYAWPSEQGKEEKELRLEIQAACSAFDIEQLSARRADKQEFFVNLALEENPWGLVDAVDLKMVETLFENPLKFLPQPRSAALVHVKKNELKFSTSLGSFSTRAKIFDLKSGFQVLSEEDFSSTVETVVWQKEFRRPLWRQRFKVGPLSLHIHLEVGASLKLTVLGSFDLLSTKISIGLQPSSALILDASASISFFIVRAGIGAHFRFLSTDLLLEGSGKLLPWPIEPCLDATLTLRPLEVRFYAFLQFRIRFRCRWLWIIPICWLDWAGKIIIPITSWGAPSVTLPLFKLCMPWQGVPPEPLQMYTMAPLSIFKDNHVTFQGCRTTKPIDGQPTVLGYVLHVYDAESLEEHRRFGQLVDAADLVPPIDLGTRPIALLSPEMIRGLYSIEGGSNIAFVVEGKTRGDQSCFSSSLPVALDRRWEDGEIVFRPGTLISSPYQQAEETFVATLEVGGKTLEHPYVCVGVARGDCSVSPLQTVDSQTQIISFTHPSSWPEGRPLTATMFAHSASRPILRSFTFVVDRHPPSPPRANLHPCYEDPFLMGAFSSGVSYSDGYGIHNGLSSVCVSWTSSRENLELREMRVVLAVICSERSQNPVCENSFGVAPVASKVIVHKNVETPDKNSYFLLHEDIDYLVTDKLEHGTIPFRLREDTVDTITVGDTLFAFLELLDGSGQRTSAMTNVVAFNNWQEVRESWLQKRRYDQLPSRFLVKDGHGPEDSTYIQTETKFCITVEEAWVDSAVEPPLIRILSFQRKVQGIEPVMFGPDAAMFANASSIKLKEGTAEASDTYFTWSPVTPSCDVSPTFRAIGLACLVQDRSLFGRKRICTSLPPRPHNTFYVTQLLLFDKQSLSILMQSDGAIADVTPPFGGFLQAGCRQLLNEQYSAWIPNPLRICLVANGVTELESTPLQYSFSVKLQTQPPVQLCAAENLQSPSHVFTDCAWTEEYLDLAADGVPLQGFSVVRNQAGLELHQASVPILVDLSPPQVPTPIIVECDQGHESFQKSTSTLFLSQYSKICFVLQGNFSDGESGLDYTRALVGFTPLSGELFEGEEFDSLEEVQEVELAWPDGIPVDGQKVFVTLMAADLAGHSSVKTSAPAVIDTSPPRKGVVRDMSTNTLMDLQEVPPNAPVIFGVNVADINSFLESSADSSSNPAASINRRKSIFSGKTLDYLVDMEAGVFLSNDPGKESCLEYATGNPSCDNGCTFRSIINPFPGLPSLEVLCKDNGWTHTATVAPQDIDRSSVPIEWWRARYGRTASYVSVNLEEPATPTDSRSPAFDMVQADNLLVTSDSGEGDYIYAFGSCLGDISLQELFSSQSSYENGSQIIRSCAITQSGYFPFLSGEEKSVQFGKVTDNSWTAVSTPQQQSGIGFFDFHSGNSKDVLTIDPENIRATDPLRFYVRESPKILNSFRVFGNEYFADQESPMVGCSAWFSSTKDGSDAISSVFGPITPHANTLLPNITIRDAIGSFNESVYTCIECCNAASLCSTNCSDGFVVREGSILPPSVEVLIEPIQLIAPALDSTLHAENFRRKRNLRSSASHSMSYFCVQSLDEMTVAWSLPVLGPGTDASVLEYRARLSLDPAIPRFAPSIALDEKRTEFAGSDFPVINSTIPQGTRLLAQVDIVDTLRSKLYSGSSASVIYDNTAPRVTNPVLTIRSSREMKASPFGGLQSTVHQIVVESSSEAEESDSALVAGISLLFHAGTNCDDLATTIPGWNPQVRLSLRFEGSEKILWWLNEIADLSYVHDLIGLEPFNISLPSLDSIWLGEGDVSGCIVGGEFLASVSQTSSYRIPLHWLNNEESYAFRVVNCWQNCAGKVQCAGSTLETVPNSPPNITNVQHKAFHGEHEDLAVEISYTLSAPADHAVFVQLQPMVKLASSSATLDDLIYQSDSYTLSELVAVFSATRTSPETAELPSEIDVPGDANGGRASLHISRNSIQKAIASLLSRIQDQQSYVDYAVVVAIVDSFGSTSLRTFGSIRIDLKPPEIVSYNMVHLPHGEEMVTEDIGYFSDESGSRIFAAASGQDVCVQFSSADSQTGIHFVMMVVEELYSNNSTLFNSSESLIISNGTTDHRFELLLCFDGRQFVRYQPTGSTDNSVEWRSSNGNGQPADSLGETGEAPALGITLYVEDAAGVANRVSFAFWLDNSPPYNAGQITALFSEGEMREVGDGVLYLKSHYFSVAVSASEDEASTVRSRLIIALSPNGTEVLRTSIPGTAGVFQVEASEEIMIHHNLTLFVLAADVAGNEAVSQSLQVVIDSTPPTLATPGKAHPELPTLVDTKLGSVLVWDEQKTTCAYGVAPHDVESGVERVADLVIQGPTLTIIEEFVEKVKDWSMLCGSNTTQSLSIWCFPRVAKEFLSPPERCFHLQKDIGSRFLFLTAAQNNAGSWKTWSSPTNLIDILPPAVRITIPRHATSTGKIGRNSDGLLSIPKCDSVCFKVAVEDDLHQLPELPSVVGMHLLADLRTSAAVEELPMVASATYTLDGSGSETACLSFPPVSNAAFVFSATVYDLSGRRSVGLSEGFVCSEELPVINAKNFVMDTPLTYELDEEPVIIPASASALELELEIESNQLNSSGVKVSSCIANDTTMICPPESNVQLVGSKEEAEAAENRAESGSQRRILESPRRRMESSSSTVVLTTSIPSNSSGALYVKAVAEDGSGNSNSVMRRVKIDGNPPHLSQPQIYVGNKCAWVSGMQQQDDTLLTASEVENPPLVVAQTASKVLGGCFPPFEDEDSSVASTEVKWICLSRPSPSSQAHPATSVQFCNRTVSEDPSCVGGPARGFTRSNVSVSDDGLIPYDTLVEALISAGGVETEFVRVQDGAVGALEFSVPTPIDPHLSSGAECHLCLRAEDVAGNEDLPVCSSTSVVLDRTPPNPLILVDGYIHDIDVTGMKGSIVTGIYAEDAESGLEQCSFRLLGLESGSRIQASQPIYFTPQEAHLLKLDVALNDTNISDLLAPLNVGAHYRSVICCTNFAGLRTCASTDGFEVTEDGAKLDLADMTPPIPGSYTFNTVRRTARKGIGLENYPDGWLLCGGVSPSLCTGNVVDVIADASVDDIELLMGQHPEDPESDIVALSLCLSTITEETFSLSATNSPCDLVQRRSLPWQPGHESSLMVLQSSSNYDAAELEPQLLRASVEVQNLVGLSEATLSETLLLLRQPPQSWGIAASSENVHFLIQSQQHFERLFCSDNPRIHRLLNGSNPLPGSTSIACNRSVEFAGAYLTQAVLTITYPSPRTVISPLDIAISVSGTTVFGATTMCYLRPDASALNGPSVPLAPHGCSFSASPDHHPLRIIVEASMDVQHDEFGLQAVVQLTTVGFAGEKLQLQPEMNMTLAVCNIAGACLTTELHDHSGPDDTIPICARDAGTCYDPKPIGPTGETQLGLILGLAVGIPIVLAGIVIGIVQRRRWMKRKQRKAMKRGTVDDFTPNVPISSAFQVSMRTILRSQNAVIVGNPMYHEPTARQKKLREEEEKKQAQERERRKTITAGTFRGARRFYSNPVNKARRASAIQSRPPHQTNGNHSLRRASLNMITIATIFALLTPVKAVDRPFLSNEFAVQSLNHSCSSLAVWDRLVACGMNERDTVHFLAYPWSEGNNAVKESVINKPSQEQIVQFYHKRNTSFNQIYADYGGSQSGFGAFVTFQREAGVLYVGAPLWGGGIGAVFGYCRRIGKGHSTTTFSPQGLATLQRFQGSCNEELSPVECGHSDSKWCLFQVTFPVLETVYLPGTTQLANIYYGSRLEVEGNAILVWGPGVTARNKMTGGWISRGAVFLTHVASIEEGFPATEYVIRYENSHNIETFNAFGALGFHSNTSFSTPGWSMSAQVSVTKQGTNGFNDHFTLPCEHHCVITGVKPLSAFTTIVSVAISIFEDGIALSSAVNSDQLPFTVCRNLDSHDAILVGYLVHLIDGVAIVRELQLPLSELLKQRGICSKDKNQNVEGTALLTSLASLSATDARIVVFVENGEDWNIVSISTLQLHSAGIGFSDITLPVGFDFPLNASTFGDWNNFLRREAKVELNETSATYTPDFFPIHYWNRIDSGYFEQFTAIRGGGEENYNAFAIVPSISGGWSAWSAWSECNNTCGDGTSVRFRTCSNPAPLGFGQPCEGPDKEERACTAWEYTWQTDAYGACSNTCGIGKRYRNLGCLRCDNESRPLHECTLGTTTTSRPPTETSCQEYTFDWRTSQWSACTDCVGGTRSRNVTCNRCDGLEASLLQCPIATMPMETEVCNGLTYSPVFLEWEQCEGCGEDATQSRQWECRRCDGVLDETKQECFNASAIPKESDLERPCIAPTVYTLNGDTEEIPCHDDKPCLGTRTVRKCFGCGNPIPFGTSEYEACLQRTNVQQLSYNCPATHYYTNWYQVSGSCSVTGCGQQGNYEYRKNCMEKVCIGPSSSMNVQVDVQECSSLGSYSKRGGTCYTDPCPSSCVAEGTPITLTNGSIKAVETLKPGELVLSGWGTPTTVLAVDIQASKTRVLYSPAAWLQPYITEDHPIIEAHTWPSAQGEIKGLFHRPELVGVRRLSLNPAASMEIKQWTNMSLACFENEGQARMVLSSIGDGVQEIPCPVPFSILIISSTGDLVPYEVTKIYARREPEEHTPVFDLITDTHTYVANGIPISDDFPDLLSNPIGTIATAIGIDRFQKINFILADLDDERRVKNSNDRNAHKPWLNLQFESLRTSIVEETKRIARRTAHVTGTEQDLSMKVAEYHLQRHAQSALPTLEQQVRRGLSSSGYFLDVADRFWRFTARDGGRLLVEMLRHKMAIAEGNQTILGESPDRYATVLPVVPSKCQTMFMPATSLAAEALNEYSRFICTALHETFRYEQFRHVPHLPLIFPCLLSRQ